MSLLISIAIVEDLPDVCAGLLSLLGATPGLTALGAWPTAEAALAALPTTGCPDVLLMDIHLSDDPGALDGIAATRLVRGYCPATQVVMCTVYEDDARLFAALQAGATGYLLKSTPPEQIVAALHEVMTGGSPMSARIARRVVSAFQLSGLPLTPNKAAPPTLPGNELTPRECDTLDLLAQGYRYRDIAARLFVSPETVKSHVRHIYEKLQARNRTEALRKAGR